MLFNIQECLSLFVGSSFTAKETLYSFACKFFDFGFSPALPVRFRIVKNLVYSCSLSIFYFLHATGTASLQFLSQYL